jgi:predicted transcriptional regulator YdeE
MSTLIKFEIKPLPTLRVIGKAVHPKMDMKENPIPAFWGQCFGDGTFGTLESLPSQIDSSYVGFMCDWTNPNGTFTYIVGMLFAADAPVPEGFTYWDCPASTAGIGWIQGRRRKTTRSRIS